MQLSKFCNYCQTEKDIDDFFSINGRIRPYCSPCSKIYNKKKHQQEVIKNGGSPRVPHKPNKYIDKTQKEQTFQFMKLCGWQFNEENGIWWKENIKTKEGEFLNIVKHKIRKYHKNNKFNDDEIKLIAEFFYNNNQNKRKTRDHYKISQPTLDKYLKSYFEKIKNG